MLEEEIYEIPMTEAVDGLNLGRPTFGIIFDGSRIDDTRLDRGKDVLVASYPRTGTTWMRQIVSLLLTNDDNYESVKSEPLDKRGLFLELKRIGHDYYGIEKFHDNPAPRVGKTHLPFRFINRWITEDKVKTIVLTRNPKDTLVSLFYFYQKMPGFYFSGTWDDFFEHVKAGKQLCGDQLEWMVDWDNNKDKGDILYVAFEDAKQDVATEIKKIARFLKLPLSDEKLERIIKDSDISVMKSAEATSEILVRNLTCYVRSGNTGEWKKHFTATQNEWFDAKYMKGYTECSIKTYYD